MNRLAQQQIEAVAVGLTCIPGCLRPLLECDVFCADPIFAGLHEYEMTEQVGLAPRSYRSLAHVCFPEHVRDRRTTLVLPAPVGVSVVLHELGHVLHQALAERAGGWGRVPRLEVVTAYARLDRWEEFAEAFVAWLCCSPRQVDQDPYWLRWSRSNDEFFDRLALA